MDAKALQKLFSKSLKEVSKLLGKPASEISKAEFHTNDKSGISEWDLRKLGGFAALKDLYFPAEKDATSVQGSKIVRNFRNKLEKEYGQRAFIQNEVLSVLEEVFTNNPIRMHKPVKSKKKNSAKKSRTILAHLSDTHYGANIDLDEMGGTNQLNWEISARRTALFMEQITGYKPQYRGDTDLVLAVNGDLVSGVIHNQEFFSDLWAVQFAGTLDIMVQAISYLAINFSKVTVIWTSGNHDRVQHKADRGRASTHKWDSLSNTIAVACKRIIEATHKNVQINIPITPYGIAEIQGHAFFITHGDTVFSTGNVGSSINMKSLNTQIAKLNASEIGGNRKFAGVLAGHVHTSTAQLTESGCMLLINGCLSGSDPFAQSIGVFESHPTQQLVEVTKEHAVGDIRMIQLKAADKRSDLDEIIKPFKGKLG